MSDACRADAAQPIYRTLPHCCLSPRWHERVCVRRRVRPCVFACVCVGSAWACARVCVHVCLCVSRDGVFAFAGVRVFVLLGGALGDVKGYSGRTHASVKRSSRGSHRLMGCTVGYLGGTPRKCVRAGVAVHRLGCITHDNGDARHCTAALGELVPPEGYSTSTRIGFMSCGPSLRVRLRRDARADTAVDARANARAHRRAVRCAVGYEYPRAL